ncbi:MAG: PmoA family protein [Pirellulaceae bacterium]|nr:PmoA family protein [Pirellulaceae bacterium]
MTVPNIALSGNAPASHAPASHRTLTGKFRNGLDRAIGSWLALWTFAGFLSVVFTIVGSDALAQSPAATTLRVEKADEPSGWNIYRGDKLFAGYILDSGGKPIVYPIYGPGGHPMTRNFPMKKDVGIERGDHDHHRSMWLTHGDVNGIDFWLDDEGCGKIVHRSGETKITDNGSAVVTTQNDWIGPDGKRVLADVRRFEFRVDGQRHIIDCDFLLKATDGNVNFGDTKEGTFGMRVAATMKVDAKKGGVITNVDLKTDKDAWGKPSPWVDYSGPIDNDLVGITIHNHPSSFGFPTRWHVRTYGLFAANPFGISHFTGGKKRDGIVLVDGKQMRLNYRVIVYQDRFDPETAKADAEAYHNDPRPPLK